jgi:uncharacterized protein (UPF0335 family)
LPVKTAELGGGQSKTLLVAFVNRIKALREERTALTQDIAGVRKEAKEAGFDSRKIEEVVRWLEDVEKNGRDEMDTAEAIFDLYREVVEGGGQSFDDMMSEARDKALLKIFAPVDQVEAKVNARTQKMRNAIAMAKAAKAARSSS